MSRGSRRAAIEPTSRPATAVTRREGRTRRFTAFGEPSEAVSVLRFLAAGIPRRSAQFIVRAIVVVRVARIAALGPIADALIALLFVFVVVHVASRRGARANAGIGQRHSAGRHRRRAGAARQGLPDERSTSNRDVRTGQNGSQKIRTGQGRSLGHPPVHVWTGSRRIAGHDDREVGGGQGAGAAGPDLENPHAV